MLKTLCAPVYVTVRNRSNSAPARTNITITGTIAGRAVMPTPTSGTNAAISDQIPSMTTATLTSWPRQQKALHRPM